MITGLFHPGSGLGNQLHRYIATRITADRLKVDFSMLGDFKGDSFMNIDRGVLNPIAYQIEEGTGKILAGEVWEEWGKFCYDPDFNFVEDNTIIDGSFEDERYFEDRLEDVNEWLKVDNMIMDDNLCVIGFRGGEYYTVPELGLPKEYYDRAIAKMLEINPNMQFEVHTDDKSLAQSIFPEFKVIRDIGINWRSVRYAKYAIIANSSFYVLPRLLNGGLTIAPKYFNRYNVKRWDYPQSYYKLFQYI